VEAVYFTPKEVAERLKLRVQTVYDYIRTGRLPAVRLGNRCRIAQSDLEAFLAQPPRPVPAKPPEQGAPGSLTEGAPREQMERNQAARRLLAEWLADESGYDEEVWPAVERLLEENPVSFGEALREHE
jgi:excisionase family DNA binding protein